MRTYIFIGCLAILGNLHVHKVASTSDPDLYLEEGGSGDTTTPDHPTDTAEGSGWKPEGKGGGKYDYDAEEDYDEEYDDYEGDEEGGSGNNYPSTFYEDPKHEGPHHPEVNSNDDDFRLTPDLPKEEVFEEILVDANVPSLEENPERMPSSTPPPTLTDTHQGMDSNNIRILTQKDDERQVSIFAQPGILAAFIGGAVMGLLCAILLVMFIVYRMRKRDEGSYPLDEPKRVPLTSSYSPNDKEIYA